VPREEFPDGIYVKSKPNNIWIQRTVELSNPRSLLVLDSFLGHLVDTVRV